MSLNPEKVRSIERKWGKTYVTFDSYPDAPTVYKICHEQHMELVDKIRGHRTEKVLEASKEEIAPIAVDCEVDIDGMRILSVDRDGLHTVFTRPESSDINIFCTVEQHNAFVARFRAKINKVLTPVSP